MLVRWLLVCLGGALGTGVRYGINLWALRRWGESFPWGTFGANVLGCFLIACVTRYCAERADISLTIRLALTTGFMGGLTTYSAFNLETTRMWQGGQARLAALNFVATTVACLMAGLVGAALARRIAIAG
ncbi:MAG: fluoride efflux transporter CrcB [Deltaproteobacteria bacterium]|nr:fluoride efflux transporter CrcB [Deltaproteobacteria bacterium]